MKLIFSINNMVHIASIPAQEKVALSNPEVKDLEIHDFLLWVIDKTVPKGATHVNLVEDEVVVLDREFRNALKPDLTYDKVLCVEITKARLRLERAPKLQALDIEQLNSEDKPTLARIKADKQRLRDVTALVNSDLTLEQMKTLHA